MFGWKFWIDPGWVIWRDVWLGILNGSGWVIWKDFWLETVMVRCLGDQMEIWSNSQKNMSLGQTDRSQVG